jgi:glycosyltransferase involved in cell wall biosynthesis
MSSGAARERVLFVSLSLDLSGQTVHIRNLTRGLTEMGYDVTVAASSLARGAIHGAEYLERAGARVRLLPPLDYHRGRRRFVADSLAVGWRISRLVRELDIDVVHAHALTMLPAARLGAAVSARPVLVATTFHNATIAPDKVRLGRLAAGLGDTAFGQVVFAVSAEMGERITRDLGVSRRLVEQIPLGIDEEYFVIPDERDRLAARRRLGIDPGDRIICSVGRLKRRKNQELLVEALALLRQRLASTRLLLAGAEVGGYADSIRQLARLRGVEEHLILAGHRDPRDVYHASDVHALVSQLDHGRTGIVLDDLTPEGFCRAVEPILRDGDGRRRMGRLAAEDFRERYSLAASAAAVDAAYRRARSEKPVPVWRRFRSMPAG